MNKIDREPKINYKPIMDWVFSEKSILLSYMKIMAVLEYEEILKNKNTKTENSAKKGLRKIGAELKKHYKITIDLGIEDTTKNQKLQWKSIKRELAKNFNLHEPDSNLKITLLSAFEKIHIKKELNQALEIEKQISNFTIKAVHNQIGYSKFIGIGIDLGKNIWEENKGLNIEQLPSSLEEWCLYSLRSVVYPGKYLKVSLEEKKRDYFTFITVLNKAEKIDLVEHGNMLKNILGSELFQKPLAILTKREHLVNTKEILENLLSYDELFTIIQFNLDDLNDKKIDDYILLFINYEYLDQINAVKMLQLDAPKNIEDVSQWSNLANRKDLFAINFSGNMRPDEFFVAHEIIDDSFGIIPDKHFDKNSEYKQLGSLLKEIYPKRKELLPKFGFVLKNFKIPEEITCIGVDNLEWKHLNPKIKYFKVSGPCLIKVDVLNRVFFLDSFGKDIYIPNIYMKSSKYVKRWRIYRDIESYKFKLFKVKVFCQINPNESNLLYLSVLTQELINNLRELTTVIKFKKYSGNSRTPISIINFLRKDSMRFWKLNDNNLQPKRKRKVIYDKFKRLNDIRLKQHLHFFNQFNILGRINLLNLHVKSPNLDAQLQIARVQFNLAKNIRKLEKTNLSEINGLKAEKEAKESEFRSLVHTLGRPHANVQSWATVLKKFFDQPDIQKAIGDQFENTFQKTISEVLLEIRNEVFRASKILEIGEDGLHIHNYKLEGVNIYDLVELAKAKQLPDNKFIIDIQHDASKTNEHLFRQVKANKELWSILLDLILDNANAHAFDTKSEKNKVHIQLTPNSHNVQIQIKNNGKPFPKNFNQKAFVTKFKTNDDVGHGIGGSDINQIIKYFGDYDWVLKLDAEAAYPVVFQFALNYASFSKQ
jgi:hypothetical protein